MVKMSLLKNHNMSNEEQIKNPCVCVDDSEYPCDIKECKNRKKHCFRCGGMIVESKTIIPTTIELDADVTEMNNQYHKPQLPASITLFGQKYIMQLFKVEGSKYPHRESKCIVKLERVEEN